MMNGPFNFWEEFMFMIPEEKKINDIAALIVSNNGEYENGSMFDEYCAYLASRAIEAVKAGNAELLAKVFKALLKLTEGEE